MSGSIDTAADSFAKGADALAKGVAHIAPHAWGTLVFQARLEAGISLALWSLVLCCAGMVCRKATSRLDSNLDDIQTATAVASGLVTVLVLLIGMICGASTLSALVNPEYAAAANLARMVRGE